MELSQLLHHLSQGMNVTTAILLVAVYNGVRVSRIERTVAALVEHHAKCPQSKKHPVSVPAALLIAFLAAVVLTGCQNVPGGFSVRLGFDYPARTNTHPTQVLTTNSATR